jgi:replicative DNA helicase
MHYAGIVREKYLLRSLQKAANDIQIDIRSPHEKADEIVARAEQRVLEIGGHQASGGLVHVGEFAPDVFDEIVDPKKPRGVETGYFELDDMLAGLQNTYLILIGARPSIGKTALSLCVCEHVAITNKVPTAFFSLEMNRQALVTRLLCQMSGVALQTVRRRAATDEDNRKLADAMHRLSASPLFIDESSRATVTDLRAKARKHVLRHGVKLVFVDYLQLMDAEGESRRVQIGAISRGLKAIAKDLNIPVVALSQLNRNSEHRDGHRPRLSDPWNCVSGDTRLIDATTGRWVPIRSIKPGMGVLATIGSNRIVAGPVADVRPVGIRAMYRLITRTGKMLVATTNHPVLTDRGWRHMGELDGSELLATARQLPPHGGELPDRYDRCRLLGYMAGNGTCLKHRSVGVIIPDSDAFADAVGIVLKHWPELKVTEKPTGYNDVAFSRVYDNGYGRPFGNPLREWLRAIDFFGYRDSDKHVPNWVFEAGVGGAAEFLSGYLATDGCAKRIGRRWTVHFDTTSPQLAADAQALLLRIGVIASISKPATKTTRTRPIFRIALSSANDNLRAFANRVRVLGYKAARLQQMVESLPDGRTNSFVEGLPPAVSSYTANTTGRRDQGKRMRRDACQSFADSTDDLVLGHWANGDVMWEDIRSITPEGDLEAWDLVIPAVNTYLAGGIVVQCAAAASAVRGDVAIAA